MKNQSKIAIHAAKNRYLWGRFAAMQYVVKSGGNLALYRLACQLEAANFGRFANLWSV